MKVAIIIWVFNAFVAHGEGKPVVDVHVDLMPTQAECLTKKANWDQLYSNQMHQSWCNSTEYPPKIAIRTRRQEPDPINDLLRQEER